jgi:hypothetical protein
MTPVSSRSASDGSHPTLMAQGPRKSGRRSFGAKKYPDSYLAKYFSSEFPESGIKAACRDYDRL